MGTQTTTAPDDIPENNPETPETTSSAAWLAEIEASKKFLQKWWDQGTRIVDRYLDARTSGDDNNRKLNLFTSNVGILISTLYARFPKPIVTREFDDQDDDIARVAANIMERMLKVRDRDDFDSAMRHVVEDRLVPGMGQIFFRFEPTVKEEVLPAVQDPLTGMELQPEMTYQKVVAAKIPCDYIFWKDFLWSPCRTWEENRWVGKRLKMTKEDVTTRFGAETAEKVGYELTVVDDAGKDEGGVVGFAEIFEIWCKRSRKIYWVAKGVETIIETRDDPFELDSFWPCPRPLFALTSTTKLCPRPDYLLVQDQYLELDDLNDRISRLEKLVKVSGCYDGGASTEMQSLLDPKTPDRLVPLRSFSEFAEKGGFKGMMDFLPIEPIVNAIDKLRQYRQDLISQIYELTGISDIMRGATKATETATAQQLKAQYGSVKLQFLQMDVARFVEEAMEIKARIISKRVPPEIILAQTNIMKSIDGKFAQQAVELLKSGEMELRIQVHADSMAIPEFNAERDGRMGFLRAFSEVMTAVTPLLEQQPMVGVTVLKMLQWAAAAFRTGQSVESILDEAIAQIQQIAMQPKQPQPPSMKEQSETKLNEARTRETVAKADKTTVDTILNIMHPPAPPEPPEPPGQTKSTPPH